MTRSHMRSLVLMLALSGLGTVSYAERLPTGDDLRFFDEAVRPVLEKRCYECHSHASGKMKNGLALDSRAGWATGGDSGPALIPGNPQNSLLIKAIHHSDPDLKMPPKDKLPADEIALLEDWVRRGAPDSRVTKGPDKPDSDWWSLKPLVRPAAPKTTGHPIDAFIDAQLVAEGISPAPEADRRTLIRRLVLDLHGVLPSVEEVDSFGRDPDPQAYERLVDRLLASPRLGERWARHWLDTIHFADTHGFEHDLMRTNAWRYRDYVIERFNSDIPWTRFIQEQLAADLFFPDQPRLTVALGFIGAGPWDQSTAQTAPRTFDYLDRDDIVTQTMSTFASSTVHCARCHDHKFDPISQEDYYGLQAVFAGIGRGDVSFDADPALDRERRAWKSLRLEAENRDAAVLLLPENEARVASWESGRTREAVWEPARPEVFVTAGESVLRLLEDGSVRAEGARPDRDTYTLTVPLTAPVTALRLEVLADESLPKKGPGRQDNGNFHLSEITLQVFRNGAAEGQKVDIRRATADFSQSGWTIQHAIDGNDKTAWGIHPQEGESHLAVFELKEPLRTAEGARLAIQLKQLHGQNHLLGRFRLAFTGDDPSLAAVLPAAVLEVLRVPPQSRSETQRVALAAHVLHNVAQERLAQLPPPDVVFAGGPQFAGIGEGSFYKPWTEPKAVHVLARGDLNKPGALAVPGALAAVKTLPARFELSHPNDEGARRVALAEWLASPENPLTWRSAVNRVWHYHLGRGLCETLNDFGRMGSRPSHPELLDWLACEFRDQGGSLKRLHKLIVTSAAYRRSTRFDEKAAARDPDNRLLWRRSRQRLEAEAFRDSVLAVAGCLDLAMGGPGVQQFRLGKPIQITPTVDYGPFDWDSPGAGRRSIYRFVYRGLPDPFLDALDFPDAAQLAPGRGFSASPLQALALLNNDFVLHHSARFAERLERLRCGTQEETVRAAFRLALLREPTREEQGEFARYAGRHGWAAMCRVLLNSNEFLFVN